MEDRRFTETFERSLVPGLSPSQGVAAPTRPTGGNLSSTPLSGGFTPQERGRLSPSSAQTGVRLAGDPLVSMVRQRPSGRTE